VPTAEQAGAGGAEYTAEIDVNDLGLDVDSLDDLPDDLDALAKELEDDDGSDTNPRPKLDVEADLLSATGITQVLQEQVGKSTVESNETTSVDEDSAYADTQLLGDSGANGGDQSGIFDLGDLSSALDDAETVQTPGAVGDTEIFGGVDLDIGVDEGGNEEPTGNEDIRGVEPQTMTEVGTKLDLARAYIDMGDPDGARGILEEVLAEGDTGQRKEAQSLIEAIGA
jgi:pilus assembly protein FimV